MAAIVLAAAGRATKTDYERLRARRLRDDVASIAQPDEEPDPRQAA
ncbi:hypothetical protein [Streptomyces sp. SCL15-4]|nr:hypothetical protein [Streptomyces sp. SCL15-4]